MNESLYDKAVAAIMELFGDTSVSQSETKRNLRVLIGEIDILMETLSDDDELEALSDDNDK